MSGEVQAREHSNSLSFPYPVGAPPPLCLRGALRGSAAPLQIGHKALAAGRVA